VNSNHVIITLVCII